MVITKILNNNAVCSEMNGEEVILVGVDLGWKSKVGEKVDESKVQKTFKLDQSEIANQLKQLVVEVPLDAIQASNEIIEYAKKELKKDLNKNIYITLTDHINFARERLKDNIQYQNMLIYEAQRLYPEEYQIGIHALDIIKDTMHIEFPLTEAGSIAIHIVNAEYEGNMETTVAMSKMIKDILDIVRYTFRIHFDLKSLNFQRFNTHLLFFTQRILKNQMLNEGKDEIYAMMEQKYPKEFSCAKKIQTYIKKEKQITITDEEVMYLCAHIARLNHRG